MREFEDAVERREDGRGRDDFIDDEAEAEEGAREGEGLDDADNAFVSVEGGGEGDEEGAEGGEVEEEGAGVPAVRGHAKVEREVGELCEDWGDAGERFEALAGAWGDIEVGEGVL